MNHVADRIKKGEWLKKSAGKKREYFELITKGKRDRRNEGKFRQS